MPGAPGTAGVPGDAAELRAENARLREPARRLRMLVEDKDAKIAELGCLSVLVRREVDGVHRRHAGVRLCLAVRADGLFPGGHGEHGGDAAAAAGHERDLVVRPGSVLFEFGDP